jgi:uncharacterized RDD family membrane protein YckC
MLIDGVVLLPLAVAPVYAFYTLANPGLAAILCTPAVVYKPLMEGCIGATVGKLACGVRVTDRQYGRIGVGAAYLRFAPLLLQSAVGIAAIAGAFSAPEFRMVSGFLGLGLIVTWGGPKDPAGVLLNAVILIDCAAAAFTSRKRALHDLLAGTVCVRRSADPTVAPNNDRE